MVGNAGLHVVIKCVFGFLFCVVSFEKREEIRCVDCEMLVFIYQRLHLWFPFDGNTLVCLACIDSAEWILLRHQALLYRSVIDGSEDSHIKGTGVATYILLLEVCLIGFHHCCIHLEERQVLILSKLHEVVKGGTIVLTCLVLSVLVKLDNDVVHEVDE